MKYFITKVEIISSKYNFTMKYFNVNITAITFFNNNALSNNFL